MSRDLDWNYTYWDMVNQQKTLVEEEALKAVLGIQGLQKMGK